MTEGFYLYRNAWRFDGAPHLEPKLAEKDWQALLQQGGMLVRNTYHFDCLHETCFWNLVKDQFGGLDELSGNTRKKVRRSLEKLDFRRIDNSLIKQSGYPILKATRADYAVTNRISNIHTFEAYLRWCEKKHYDYWGVFDRTNGTFIGFCANRLWTEACEYGLAAILPKYKRKCSAYPYYGLFYSMNQYYLQERGFRYVTDGTRSITEHSEIQDFLIDKFHFRKSYCDIAIHYCRWMKMAVAMLYPIRKIITLPRIRAILNMEAMRREEK